MTDMIAKDCGGYLADDIIKLIETSVEYRHSKMRLDTIYSRPLYQVIQDAYYKAAERKYDKVYWMIDIHGTIVKSSYRSLEDQAKNGDIDELYGDALNTMRYLLCFPETHIILWSSMTKAELAIWKQRLFGEWEFAPDRVFLNENPLEQSNVYADFSVKPYFSILLDDKAGFVPDMDWRVVSTSVEDNRDTLIRALPVNHFKPLLRRVDALKYKQQGLAS